jgi:hypothetical protein
MAKKAKKTKKAKKSKKGQRATTTTKTHVTVPMQSVVQFVKALISEGRDVEFEGSAAQANAVVIVDDDGTAFVKQFLAQKQALRRGMRAAILHPCPGNPFGC